MRYLITSPVMGQTGEVEISRAEYEQIVEAKRGVVFALGVEEVFALLRDNYRDYERALFNAVQDAVIYSQPGWSERVAVIYEINRHLLNVLASARLYKDHVSTELTARFGIGSPPWQAISAARDREDADSLAFAFMEALRNAAQHQTVPVSNVDIGMGVDHRSASTRLTKHTISPRVRLSALRKSRKFSATLAERLSAYTVKDQIPITRFMRDYMQAFGRIHEATRLALAEQIAQWDAAYLEALRRGETVCDNTPICLCCEADDDAEEAGDPPAYPREDLFDDLIRRRQYLAARSSRANFMPGGHDYVSTE